jgi:hypothetical protein
MDDQLRKRPGDDSQRAHLNGEGRNMENELRPEVAAHLQEDASSPEEMRELRATAALLGALPQVAPRRTFILTPEQVAASGGQRPTRRLGWVWPTRWATAFAAVCFAITLGLGQGTSPEPTIVAPSPTVAMATATTRTALDPGNAVVALGTVVSVDPVPTAVIAPPPAPVAAPPEPTDWRSLQIALGALTALGAFCGFVLPPFLRRRSMTTA